VLTFTTDTFPQGESVCGLIWVVLWGIRLVLMIQVGRFSNLKMIDVDVEPAAAAFSQWIWELLVGFAEDAMLRVLE
jgi:hypothetical protein